VLKDGCVVFSHFTVLLVGFVDPVFLCLLNDSNVTVGGDESFDLFGHFKMLGYFEGLIFSGNHKARPLSQSKII
jgi:hypothetical protein